MILEESADVAAPPAAVVAFLLAMDEHYRAWHPDHIAFRWLDPPQEPRRRFSFSERIGRWTIGATMTMARSADGGSAVCRPVSLPYRLVFAAMSFATEPTPGGCRYVHRIHLRLGPLRPLLERTLLAPLRRHMREETANLARLAPLPRVGNAGGQSP